MENPNFPPSLPKIDGRRTACLGVMLYGRGKSRVERRLPTPKCENFRSATGEAPLAVYTKYLETHVHGRSIACREWGHLIQIKKRREFPAAPPAGSEPRGQGGTAAPI